MTIEEQLELRKRLLSYVVKHLNDGVIRTASGSISELLSDVPALAEELLQPIFENSSFWPEQMGKEALGITTDDEFSVEELLSRFEALEAEGF